MNNVNTRGTRPQARTSGPGGSGGRPTNDRPAATLPAGYLKGGYFEEGTQVVKREYILQYAKDLALKLSSERPEIKKTQLRGFYDKVKNTRDSFENGNITLNEAIVSVCELAPLANQSVTKGNAPRLFNEFVSSNVDNVHSGEELKAFEQHFRAIVCYYPENKGKK